MSRFTAIDTSLHLYREAREYGTHVHAAANHLYDGLPYAHHLQMVADAADANAESCGLLSSQQILVCAAAWVHDAIEDARQTYNDVKKVLGVEVAELAYALTNEKGRTRKERANERYYAGIRALPLAVYLKGCDRLANIRHGLHQSSPSRMVKMYAQEQSEFRKSLGVDTAHPYAPLFDRIELEIGDAALGSSS